MPPSNSSQPPPLPVASDRAALSNRISMLLASQSSVLQTMNLHRPSPSQSSPSSSSTQQPPASRHRQQQRPHTTAASADIDDEDMWKGTRPNEGVGYVGAATGRDAGKEDKMLRGRLLGKRKDRAGGTRGRLRAAGQESESEEDEGRSGLGKRKRVRAEGSVGGAGGATGAGVRDRAAAMASEAHGREADADDALDEVYSMGMATVPDNEEQSAPGGGNVAIDGNANPDMSKLKPKKKKNKNKKKSKAKEGNATGS